MNKMDQPRVYMTVGAAFIYEAILIFMQFGNRGNACTAARAFGDFL